MTSTLVMKDRDSKAVAAWVVPMKCGEVAWVVTQVVKTIRRWGIRGDLVLRSDQERALKDFAVQVIRKHTEGVEGGAKTTHRDFLESSAVGDSQGNGFIESGVKAVEGQVRTLKHALEAHIKMRVEVDQPIFEWMVAHAADLITLFQPGDDGQTPYERLKGRPWHGEMLEFACRVWHRIPGKLSGGVM